MTETNVEPTVENTDDAVQTQATEVPVEGNTEKPKRKNPGPRLTVEEPGPLATLEAQWLKDTYGIEVTSSQVRAILMYHGEFQKSDARKAQKAEIKNQRVADRERREIERNERQAKAKAEAEAKVAAKAEAKVAKEAEKESDPQAESDSPSEQPKRTSALKRNRSSKKQEPVGANAEF